MFNYDSGQATEFKLGNLAQEPSLLSGGMARILSGVPDLISTQNSPNAPSELGRLLILWASHLVADLEVVDAFADAFVV
jgi:hypothetical protein